MRPTPLRYSLALVLTLITTAALAQSSGPSTDRLIRMNGALPVTTGTQGGVLRSSWSSPSTTRRPAARRSGKRPQELSVDGRGATRSSWARRAPRACRWNSSLAARPRWLGLRFDRRQSPSSGRVAARRACPTRCGRRTPTPSAASGRRRTCWAGSPRRARSPSGRRDYVAGAGARLGRWSMPAPRTSSASSPSDGPRQLGAVRERRRAASASARPRRSTCCTRGSRTRRARLTGIAVQNLGSTATSYSGMLFYDQNGALGQFQGFNNATHEYRINNIAAGGSINFMLGGSSKFLVGSSGDIEAGTALNPRAFAATSPSQPPGNGIQGVAVFDRVPDDGTLVRFRRNSTTVGTIDVAAGVVSYNAFTGSHFARTDEVIERGMLVSLTGDNGRLEDNPGVGDSLRRQEEPAGERSRNHGRLPRSSARRRRRNLSESVNPHLVEAVGNGEMWVIDTGRNLVAGDYLVSSAVAGHAMADPGTFDVSYIIARLAEPIDWTTVTDTVRGADGRDAQAGARLGLLRELRHRSDTQRRDGCRSRQPAQRSGESDGSARRSRVDAEDADHDGAAA